MRMVEWKKIWEVTTWDKKFTGVDKYMQPEVIKYHYYLANELADIEKTDGDIRILYTTDKVAFVDSSDVEGNISDGEVVCIPWGGNVSVKYYKGPFVTADNRIATSNNKRYLNNKYLYYWMDSQKDEIGKYYRGAGIKHPSMLSILSMLIPIPSFFEQERIVGILDTFTSSIDNLKQQITQRRKQYEYYRDQLLDLEGKEGVEMKTLGEILQVKKGDYITKKEAKEGIYPVILGGKEPAYYINKFNHTGKAIVISRSGASAGYVSFWDEPIFVTDGFLIEPKENVSIEYLYYLLKSKQRELHGAQKGGAIPHVTPAIIEAIVTALPDKPTQRRIVDILDKFEASIRNLEAQLSQREKQYEYYRNKLLTF